MKYKLIVTGMSMLFLSGCNLQTNLIFYPKKLELNYSYKPNTQTPFNEVFFPTEDKQTLNGLFFSNDTNKVILYFHGNAGSLDSWQHIYGYYQNLGLNFFIIDYRGYGKSTGEITEKGLYMDAQAAYNYLIEKGFEKKNIIVLGRSIGTGMAVDLASKNMLNGLILEAPFFDFVELVKSKIPIPIISRYKFHNMEKINSVTYPILFIHGGLDDLIPPDNSQKLYTLFKGKKELLLVPNAGHNNLPDSPNYNDAIDKFLKEDQRILAPK
jgi:fermentation-respiration switch protein FrsA (DUF1100 family)